jgi:DNA-binding GntR family transcriptional regulator
MTPFLMAPIRITSLADTVAERLRKAIITGDLQPGEHLSEPALASQMCVSRSPVREALQILKADGLVEEYPNHSNYVWLPTPKDVVEIFSLRTMIETLASEWLVEHLSAENVADMEKIIADQRQAIDASDLYRMMDSDKRFHEYICTSSNHRRLNDWWNQLMWQWEVLVYRRVRMNPAQVLLTVIEDHTAILEAIRTHNLPRVRDLHYTINIRVAENIKNTIVQEPQ